MTRLRRMRRFGTRRALATMKRLRRVGPMGTRCVLATMLTLPGALLALAACSPPETPAPAPQPAVPVVDYAEPIVLLVEPDSLAIEQMKQRLGDDFYVVADDAMWYRALALELLDSLQMPYADAPRDSASFLVAGQRALVRWADVEMAWFAIVYDGERAPTITADADLRAVLLPQE